MNTLPIAFGESDRAKYGERIRQRTLTSENGCHIWTRATNRDGYGQIRIGGKLMIASRVAFAVFKEPLSRGEIVCHTCDTPSCVNPSHLYRGTHKQNTDDAIRRGRMPQINILKNPETRPTANRRVSPEIAERVKQAIAVGESYIAISTREKISMGSISRIRHGYCPTPFEQIAK